MGEGRDRSIVMKHMPKTSIIYVWSGGERSVAN